MAFFCASSNLFTCRSTLRSNGRLSFFFPSFSSFWKKLKKPSLIILHYNQQVMATTTWGFFNKYIVFFILHLCSDTMLYHLLHLCKSALFDNLLLLMHCEIMNFWIESYQYLGQALKSFFHIAESSVAYLGFQLLKR